MKYFKGSFLVILIFLLQTIQVYALTNQEKIMLNRKINKWCKYDEWNSQQQTCGILLQVKVLDELNQILKDKRRH